MAGGGEAVLQVAGEGAGTLAGVQYLLQIARRVVLVIPPENVVFPVTLPRLLTDELLTVVVVVVQSALAVVLVLAAEQAEGFPSALPLVFAQHQPVMDNLEHFAVLVVHFQDIAVHQAHMAELAVGIVRVILAGKALMLLRQAVAVVVAPGQ